MTFSIDFNDEARQRTEEIGEVRAYGHLASELVPADFPTAEPRPNEPLDFGHIVAKLSRSLDLR